MINKKILLSLSVVAIILILGVGYAVVNTVDITLGGTASVADAPIKVGIENVTSSTTESANITNSWKNAGETTDTFTITNMKLNETATITYTLKNNEVDVVAKLMEAAAITNSNSEYFEVTSVNNVSELSPGTTGTVKITVKLKKTPIDEQSGTTTISYTVKASAKNN